MLALLRGRMKPTRARGIKYLAGSRTNYYLQNQILNWCFSLRLRSVIYAICPHGNEGKKCISCRFSGFTVRRDQRCRTCPSLAWRGFGICISSVRCPPVIHRSVFSLTSTPSAGGALSHLVAVFVPFMGLVHMYVHTCVCTPWIIVIQKPEFL